MPAVGLHPVSGRRPGQSQAETKLYEALQSQLPDGWSAWHSLTIRRSNNILGEGDFIVADPKRGFLVLEVKGGILSQRDGRWFQNSRPMKQPPLSQASGFAKALADRFTDGGDAYVPPFGAAVCFPDTAFDDQPSQDDLRGVVIGQRELPYLKDILPTVMDRALPKRAHPRGREWLDALHTLWGETWVQHLGLGARAADIRETRFGLDAQQQYALDALLKNNRVLVTGPAGSGKTLLAAEAARREVAAGRRVLFLCYTRALAHCIARRLDGITCATVSHFARTIHEEAGRKWVAPTDGQGWARLSMEAGELATSTIQVPYDTVILDEAQDLTEADWLLVSMLGEKRRLLAFQDEAQRFWSDRGAPEGEFPTKLPLPAPHRCPNGVQALADRFVGRAPGDGTDTEAQDTLIRAALQEDELGIVACPSRSSVPDKVAEEVRRLASQGVKLRDIFVVSLRGQAADDAIFHHKQVGPYPMVTADHDDMESLLVADSFLRIKGMERPVVIVTDFRLLERADGRGRMETGVRMHIALTRSLLAARIVAAKEDLQAEPILAALLDG